MKKATNLYIDAEWFLNQKIFLIGYKFEKQETEFLIEPKEADIVKLFEENYIDHVFVYGPDVAMIEKAFHVDIKTNFFCVKVHKMVRRLVPQECTRLNCMEDIYQIQRKQKKYKQNIFKLFKDWQHPKRKKLIMEYNKQDVESLQIITNELITTFKPDLNDFRLLPPLPKTK